MIPGPRIVFAILAALLAVAAACGVHPVLAASHAAAYASIAWGLWLAILWLHPEGSRYPNRQDGAALAALVLLAVALRHLAQ